MRMLKVAFSLSILLLMGILLNNVEAQTEDELIDEWVGTKPPSPPSSRFSYWDELCDSWSNWECDGDWGFNDDWSCSDAFLGINYSYSKQFPISFSLQYHRHLAFVGLGFGLSPKHVTYDYSSSTLDSSLSYIGDTPCYYYFNRDSVYSVTPKGFVFVEPGINFDFVTISCGIGWWWGDCKKHFSIDGISYSMIDKSGGLMFNPNVMLHLPIPGTDDLAHLTFNVGYHFLLPFGIDDPVDRKLASRGNGWRFGVGVEFNISYFQ